MTLPRLYPILDTGALERFGIAPLVAAEAFLEGGAGILQYRHKQFWSRDTFAEARQIREMCRSAGVTFILNDRADYAAIIDAGLHLGQDDLAPWDARDVIGPAALLGFSTHHASQVEAAALEPADYVAFGPVFDTASKQRPDPTVGLFGLRVARDLTSRPLVAIGGITRANAGNCFEAGADAVAVIGDLLPVSCPVSDAKQTIRNRMTEWQKLIQR